MNLNFYFNLYLIDIYAYILYNVCFQVPVNSWFDDMSDTELRDLIPFFEQLSKMDDVYSVLRNSNHAAGSHPQPNTLNGSHFISPQIQHVNGFMQPS